ncbi:MAG: Nramp family divalent metal transporter [Sedimentisphaerales bacterium]|nr:Nramp family divalent metal transporter [Sedimentisphaerales bacterium]
MTNGDTFAKDPSQIKAPPYGWAILAFVGPSMVWCAEYIGSGEVILATRTGSLLGTGILWAVVLGIFLKFWIGLSGARYTVCTGEGMVDMFDRIPGPSHWVVWIVLVIQFISATLSIGSIATAAGVFLNNLIPVISAQLCGSLITILAILVVWSGVFDVLRIVMSILVLIIVLGVLYVTIHVFPSLQELLTGLGFHVPDVPAWAMEKGITANPWREILPLIGWGAGGFASQVWYSYWVLGAGYGACAGRPYGEPARIERLKVMNQEEAKQIKGWCHVLYTDATLAMLIGIIVTGCFLIAGAGVLRPNQLIPEGPDVALTLSSLFSSRWGHVGGFLFLLSGTAALVSTQIGQLAGWPRLLADSFRLCLPRFASKFSWKIQFRAFLLFFLYSNITIVYIMGQKPVVLVKLSAVLDGLLLTPLQALWIAIGLFWVMPRILSRPAWTILKPNWIFALGLLIAFLVFAYFCAFQIPSYF